MTQLDIEYLEFSRDLDKVNELLDILDTMDELGSAELKSKGKSNFFIIAMELRSILKQNRTDMPIISGTLLLYLSGRFEHFVKTSFQALCDEMSDKCSAFNDLPEKMRDSILAYTARVAASPQKYGYENIEAFGMLSTLVSSHKATSGLNGINSECLSITDSNMRPAIIVEIYKRIGITQFWERLCSTPVMQMHFKDKSVAKIEHQARSFLNQMMDDRNDIAHPSNQTSFPDTERIRECILFIKSLSQSIVEISKVELATFNP